MSAIVTGRGRRSTAGKRMSELTGKAVEDDNAFWGHETWNEEDSGNESFHSSDEESVEKQDVFDSDFDESESDREEEEAEAGDEEDKEIARDERKRKQGKATTYSDVTTAAKGIKRPKGLKRVLGDGLNAGIVLNAPGPPSTAPYHATAAAGDKEGLIPAARVAASSQPPSKSLKSEHRVTAASTRPRRTTHLSKYSSRFRAARPDAAKATGVASSTVSSPATTAAASKKKKRHRYTQEELLMEAVHKTEGENTRWLLARKRTQDQQKDDEVSEGRGRKSGGKLIERYNSRKGYLNTITFPEMDHLPEIFASLSNTSETISLPPSICVVTGLAARYRDPKTGLGYHDVAAFKELRRRSNVGEPLDQRKKPHVSRSGPTNGNHAASLSDALATETNEVQSNLASVSNGLASSANNPPAANSSPFPPFGNPFNQKTKVVISEDFEIKTANKLAVEMETNHSELTDPPQSAHKSKPIEPSPSTSNTRNLQTSKKNITIDSTKRKSTNGSNPQSANGNHTVHPPISTSANIQPSGDTEKYIDPATFTALHTANTDSKNNAPPSSTPSAKDPSSPLTLKSSSSSNEQLETLTTDVKDATAKSPTTSHSNDKADHNAAQILPTRDALVSVGNASKKKTKGAPASPPSPRRASPRKRKPTTKVLETFESISSGPGTTQPVTVSPARSNPDLKRSSPKDQ